MKELNELIEALYPQYGAPGSRDVDVTARRRAIDESAAVIAEALLKLEQRAEAAEAKACQDPECHTDFMPVYKEMVARGKYIDELEAKLAEYEKQEPFGFCNEDAKNSDVFSATVWREREDAESRSCGLELFPLFTRPAPATSPAELVPDCLVDAMCNLDLAGVSIGDKAIIGKAIEVLQNIEQHK